MQKPENQNLDLVPTTTHYFKGGGSGLDYSKGAHIIFTPGSTQRYFFGRKGRVL